MIIDAVQLILDQVCNLDRGKPLLVAVSGGPDSLCLLDLLIKLDYTPIVAYFNHQIRPESEQEILYIADLASDYNCNFCSDGKNVVAYARENKLSVEEAGRKLRYEFLFEKAVFYEAQAVLTGHTADDQAETVLMHILRGSGLFGLSGMAFRTLPNPWSKMIPHCRPLLDVWREDIQNYLEQFALRPIDDHTNWDMRYFRNRIRHELLPTLERASPGLRRRLWQMSRLINDDREIIKAVISNAWDECISQETLEWIAFDLEEIRKQSLAIQRYLLRQAIHKLQPDQVEIDYKILASGGTFISQSTADKHIDLPGGLRLKIFADRLWVGYQKALLPDENDAVFPRADIATPISLAYPGIISLANDWVLETLLFDNSQSAVHFAQNNSDPFQAWIDLETVSEGLQVRSRFVGDRIKPLGMSGHSMKVSDLMINKKIPKHARDSWPVVTSGDRIAWIPGLCLADPFRLTDQSKSALLLHLKKTA